MNVEPHCAVMLTQLRAAQRAPRTPIRGAGVRVSTLAQVEARRVHSELSFASAEQLAVTAASGQNAPDSKQSSSDCEYQQSAGARPYTRLVG